jgi:hypothetical protein
MRLFLIGFLVFGMLSNSCASEVDLNPVLVGSRENVVDLIRRSAAEEFGSTVVNRLPTGVGFSFNFMSLLSGKNYLSARVFPMATGEETEPTAFSVSFSNNAQYFDSVRAIKQLVEQMQKLSNDRSGVKFVSDKTRYRSLSDQGRVCAERLKSDPTFSNLGKRISLGKASELTLMMRTDDGTPNQAERDELAQYAQRKSACFNLVRESFDYFDPDPRMSNAVNQGAAFDAIVVKLYKGEMTFAQFNEQRDLISREASSTANSIAVQKEQDRTKLETRQAELDRQRMIEAQRISIEQQKADAMTAAANKPAPIPQSPPISCTSSALGNRVQTNCY